MPIIQRSFVSYLSLVVVATLFFILGVTIRTPYSSQTQNAPLLFPRHSKRASGAPPPIGHILETCLYVRRMDVAVKFYREVLGLKDFMVTDRLSAFSLGTTTLLIFHLGYTSDDLVYKGTPGMPGTGEIAGHGPDTNIVSALGLQNGTKHEGPNLTHPEVSLKLHYALAVEKREDVYAWEAYFKEKNVHVHSTMDWERGGRSVYFYDPDGHVGEIVSRGIWPHW